MSDKKYFGNLYKTDKIEETPDDCPSCIHQDKRAKRDPDECSSCYYILNKEKKKGQEQLDIRLPVAA